MYRKCTPNTICRQVAILIKGQSKRELNVVTNSKIIDDNFDVAIFGGGIMGLSTSFWLKRHNPSMNVIVVERDAQYKTASTVLSAGGIRQQFTLKENIEMSRFTAQFIENINEYLWVQNDDNVDVQFKENGYLFLSESENGDQILRESHKLQCELNASTELKTPEELQNKFPWLNIDNIHLGCFGSKHEGHFDPYLLLMALKRKALNLGVKYVNAEVNRFVLKSTGRGNDTCNSAVIKFANGNKNELKFSNGIIAAGAQSGKLSQQLRIGDDVTDCRRIRCPVEPRKRYIFIFDCPSMKNVITPMVIDSTGAYFRSDGKLIIGGKAPGPEEEPDISNMDVDYSFFENEIWPPLARRVKAFEEIKIRGGWSGFYDNNVIDENAIIGKHPYYSNFYWITGFSGHGLQMSIAAGRAVSELIEFGSYRTIDVSRFGWQRILDNAPLYETNII